VVARKPVHFPWAKLGGYVLQPVWAQTEVNAVYELAQAVRIFYILAPHPAKSSFCTDALGRRKELEQGFCYEEPAGGVVDHLAPTLLKNVMAAERVAHGSDDLAQHVSPPP
jgi:hypothetical protein